MPKTTDRRRAKAYSNGQVFFGKWIASEGIVGDVRVLDTPSMVIIPKPGRTVSELARSLGLVVKMLENDERLAGIENDGIAGDGAKPLEYVLKRLDQFSVELSIVRRKVLDEVEVERKGKDGVEG